MKSRSKRNRKRPRGGIGCLVGDGCDLPSSKSALLRIETVPLSKAFDIIIANTDNDASTYTSDDTADMNDSDRQQRQMSDNHRIKRVRIIYPYPFTFATFAKARWIGRTVVDVYHDEFGKIV